jgi:hypothetical protein
MQRFFCDCGQEVFLENRFCVRCGATLAFDPAQASMVTLDEGTDGWYVRGDARRLTLCSNRLAYGVCNAIVTSDDNDGRCLLCRLNRTIPDLSKADNIKRWSTLEQAKRRLFCGLFGLGLPMTVPVAGSAYGIHFDFLEDQRTNPNVPEEFVTTGYSNGLITINVLEADDVQRVWQKELSSERYRTVLGHMRHEVGHYYFELLVSDVAEFDNMFGDHSQSYAAALEQYYRDGPRVGWEQDFISAYASAHPTEDWAECFAHHLHMTDTLVTASQRGLIPPIDMNGPIDTLLVAWDGFAVTLNELNHSLGFGDAYPFVVTPVIADKLRYIHRLIAAYREQT